MTSIRGIDLVPLMIAASGLDVIPARMPWPMHRCLAGLSARSDRMIRGVVGDLGFVDDPEIGRRSTLADASLETAVREGVLRQVHTGLLARWIVDDTALQSSRRKLLKLDARAVAALRQCGKRWATLSVTVLKNLDSAAASWGSTVAGETSVPTERQPLLRVVL